MPNVKLALSYYAERPKGVWAEGNRGREYMKEKIDFERKLYDTLDEMEAPRTIFILGEYLKGCLKDFSEDDLKELYVDSPFSDPQSHGFKHQIYRKKEFEDKEPTPIDKFMVDLSNANQCLKSILGITPKGVGFPYGFESDFSEDTGLLKGLVSLGVEYISTDTSGKDTLEAPLSPDRQPHSYKESGFPELIQIPTSGWQDVIFTDEKRERFGFDRLKSPEEIIQYYKNSVERTRDFDLSTSYVSFCLHPWAIMEYDPKLEITKMIVNSARDMGADIVSFSQIADEFLERA